MHLRHRLIAIAALFLMVPVPVLADKRVTLPSGKSIELLRTSQPSQANSVLTLKYRTMLPAVAVEALRKEAEEVWELLLEDVNKQGLRRAVISAVQPEKASARPGRSSVDFVFEKHEGWWHTLESNERARAKLDAAFIRQLAARIDRAWEQGNLAAMSLYMAKDWTFTVRDATDESMKQAPIDRELFIIGQGDRRAYMSRTERQREILEIAIASDGASARMESRIVDEQTPRLSGRYAVVSRHTDTFELRGDIVLWTAGIHLTEARTP
jgi:hypothetical protein